MMKQTLCNALIVAVGVCLAGCGEKPGASGPPAASQKHHHTPPHGGTAVELGAEEFHVELVLDAAAGKLQAYVLDAHMENFVRLPLESFEVNATNAGQPQTLVFKPVANAATGEKAGDTSQFEAQGEWLKTAKTFDAVLKQITVRGKSYQAVKFNFPKGNE
jgi:hypothetical protein